MRTHGKLAKATLLVAGVVLMGCFSSEFSGGTSEKKDEHSTLRPSEDLTRRNAPEDWAQLLTGLAEEILSRVGAQVYTLKQPARPDTIVMTHDGSPVDAREFSFDAAVNSIRLN